MLDIGWTELLIIGVVALIVVGPKDLPKMFRTLGQITGKARAMAREFQSAMDAAADESGVKDIARDLRDTASGRNLREAAGLDEMEREFRDLERDMQDDPRSKGPSRAAGGKAGDKAGNKAGGKGRRARPAAADPQDEDAFDEAGADEDLAADLDARNKAHAAREAERLKRAERAASARRKAAELRARREAEAQEGKGTAPAARAAAPMENPRPASRAADAAFPADPDAPPARDGQGG